MNGPPKGNIPRLQRHCATPLATAALAAALADACQGARALLALKGPLGAGKTHFARAFGQRWGSETPLSSPTFTLCHEHRRASDGQRLFHLDGYRLTHPDQARALGIEELLTGEDIVIVEWPERFGAALPRARLTITFQEAGKEGLGRRLTLQPCGADADAALRRLLASEAASG